jgi:hypothetical protein
MLVFFANLYRYRGPLGRGLDRIGIPGWAAALALLAILFLLLTFGLRWLLLQSTPEQWAFLPAHPQQFPRLDGAELNGYTATLQELGFQWVADYTLVKPGATLGSGFARLFFHPLHLCYAELGQVFPPNQDPLPLCCTCMSTVGKDWMLSTTNRQANGFVYMLRRAKNLWSSHPKLNAPALLQAHLRKRTEIATELALPVRSDLSWDAYWASEQQSQTERRAVLRRRNLVIGLAEAMWFRWFPKTEWMGDYARLHAKGGSKRPETAE